MDTGGVERVDFNALGGADIVTVNDLTGTDVRTVNVDLAGTLGGATGDNEIDQVVVNGNERRRRDQSRRRRRRREGEAALSQRSTSSTRTSANDQLDINTLAGTDTVNSGGLPPA